MTGRWLGGAAPTIGSVFSGYGGLDLGVQAALGGEVVWHSENDPAPARILRRRWPDVPNHGDITAVDWAAVEPVDVLAGGFPCPDLSLAGLRRGLRPDTRSGLWSHFALAIAALRPSLVIVENVRGLLSAEAHSDLEPDPWGVADRHARPALRALGAVLGDLADLGYDATWRGVRASDVGAPHQRFRVFLAARPAEDADFELGRERESAAPRPPEGGRPRPDAGGRGRLPAADSGGQTRDVWPGPDPRDPHGQRWARPDHCAATHAADEPGSDLAERADPPALVGAAARAGDRAAGRSPAPRVHVVGRGPLKSAPDPERLHDERRRGPGHLDAAASPARNPDRYPTDEVGHTAHRRSATPRDWGPYATAIHRWQHRLGRPAPDPTDGRRLSPGFVEWMMGLPLGHVTDTGLTRAQQLRALGNGVVPQQAELAVRLLLDLDTNEATA